MRKPALTFAAALLALLLSACSAGTNPAPDDLMLSNTRFEDTAAPEDRALLASVKSILEAASIERVNERLSAVNTSGETLDIEFMALHYDREGGIVGSSRFTIHDWEPGVRLNADMTGGLDRYTAYERSELAAEFVCGDHYVRTDFIPASLDVTTRIRVVTEEPLPLRLTLRDLWSHDAEFTVTQVEYSESLSGTSALSLYVTKNSGEPSSYETIPYRLLNRDTGAAAAGGDFYFHYLSAGESIMAQDGSILFSALDPGTYVIDFLVDDIESGA